MRDFENFITDLKELISYKSVLSKPQKDAPFGLETKKALDFFLKKAQRMGFETVNYDNYLGEIALSPSKSDNSNGLASETPTEIGIIGHLDVVPEGEGWQTPPYTLTFKDGYYFGRGVSDDKAPCLLVLYALKELKESGLPLKRKIRFFVGTNEESGWQDVEHFEKTHSFPEYGFSPDGNFPVIYAEKGMSIVKFTTPLLKNFEKVTGGTVINAVCGKVTATIKDITKIDKTLAQKYGLTITDENQIISIGKSAHGSSPSLGKNAILPLLQFMKECGEKVDDIIDCLFLDKFGLTKNNNEQGYLTISPDLIYEKDGLLHIDCDMRIPAPMTAKEIERTIKKFGIEYSITEKHPPVMIEKDGWFARTLIDAYNQVTGENKSPVAMGGSTFARVFKKGSAFGMEFIGEDAHMHEANERVSKDNLLRAYEIYKWALFKLTVGDFC